MEVIRKHKDKFKVHTLVAGSNLDLLLDQARAFNPKRVLIGDESKFEDLKLALYNQEIELETGSLAIAECVKNDEIDIVIAAIVGFDGLRPVYEACKAGKRIGLANKETLVVAGELIMRTAREFGAEIIPVDSEHSAIFQCLVGEANRDISKIILTASGGPFRNRPVGEFKGITKAEALNHPNWDMGPKISIDSATMMNKGLEVIEARWLFDQSANMIDVVIHPQSIIHSMVEFVDGSYKAQLGVPDMKVPIQYALSYPNRIESDVPKVDWKNLGNLEFSDPDQGRFPCLYLAFDALREGGSATTVLNAANEQVVSLFLKDQLSFVEIPSLVEQVLESAPHYSTVESISHLEEIDASSRSMVMELRKGKAY